MTANENIATGTQVAPHAILIDAKKVLQRFGMNRGIHDNVRHIVEREGHVERRQVGDDRERHDQPGRIRILGARRYFHEVTNQGQDRKQSGPPAAGR
ncbi:MAG: hypothetical protein U5K33_07580 [Halofilum sp. (in: g-proteobacteria)]|nr:hypothetical protein [Halofilum sp. (in: g-proteobacteria)]